MYISLLRPTGKARKGEYRSFKSMKKWMAEYKSNNEEFGIGVKSIDSLEGWVKMILSGDLPSDIPVDPWNVYGDEKPDYYKRINPKQMDAVVFAISNQLNGTYFKA